RRTPGPIPLSRFGGLHRPNGRSSSRSAHGVARTLNQLVRGSSPPPLTIAVSTTEAVGAIRRFRRFRVADRVRQFAGVLTLFGVLWLVRALAGIGGFLMVCGVLLVVSLTLVARARATSGDGRCCGKGPSIVLD